MKKYLYLLFILVMAFMPISVKCKLPVDASADLSSISSLELETILALFFYKLATLAHNQYLVGSSFSIPNNEGDPEPVSLPQTPDIPAIPQVSLSHQQFAEYFSLSINVDWLVQTLNSAAIQNLPPVTLQPPLTDTETALESGQSGFPSIDNVDSPFIPDTFMTGPSMFVSIGTFLPFMQNLFPPPNPYTDVAPSVTFSIENENDLVFAQILSYIKQTNQQSDYPNQNLQTTLSEFETFIQALQNQQIPETYPLNSLNTVVSSIEQPSLASAILDLSTNFLTLVATDYCMYAMITQQAAAILAEYIRQLPDSCVEEPQAGAGWYQMALSQQGITIHSSDNYNIRTETSIIEIQTISLIKERLRPFCFRGPVVQQDAITAVTETKYQIVLLCFPEHWSSTLLSILEECARRGLLIIHISYQEETFSALSDLYGTVNEFIPVDNPPDLQITGQVLEIGFWRNIPEWYQRFSSAHKNQPLEKKD